MFPLILNFCTQRLPPPNVCPPTQRFSLTQRLPPTQRLLPPNVCLESIRSVVNASEVWRIASRASEMGRMQEPRASEVWRDQPMCAESRRAAMLKAWRRQDVLRKAWFSKKHLFVSKRCFHPFLYFDEDDLNKNINVGFSKTWSFKIAKLH